MRHCLSIGFFILLSFLKVSAQSRNLLKLNKELVQIAKKDNLPSFELIVWSPNDSIFIDYHDPAVQNIDTYGIGSSTKLLVAVYVLDLIGRGKLSLNDEIGTFFKVEDLPKIETITVRQLLNHTSGIPDYTRNPNWVNLVISNNTPQSFEERFDLIDFKMKPLNSFHYSNSNYLFLEKIVEKVTGEPYDQAYNHFYEDQGLPAIKMMTAIDTTPAFFAQESNETSDVTATQETYGYAGDVHTNSDELLNLLKKLFVEKSLLKPSLMDQLQQWVSMKAMTIPIGTGTIDQYGAGIMKLTYNDKILIGHSGGTLKYQSFLFYNPENSTILIGLTNSSGTHYNNSFIQRILPAALERI